MGQADRAVQLLAGQQNGVFARRQAIDVGCSDGMVQRRLESGLWVASRFPGVYRLPSCPVTWHQELHAGLLWAGPDSQVGGRAAGALYRADRCPEGPLELLLPLHADHAAPPGVRVRRTADPGPMREIDGLRVTSPEMMLLGVARAVRADVLDDVVESTIELGLTTPDRILEVIGRRAGSGPIRAVLEGRRPGRARQRRLEGEFWRLMRAAGIELVQQHEVVVGEERYFLDFAAPALMVGFELDGFGKLQTKSGKQRFLRRATRLQIAGWRLLHFSWDDVMLCPNEVVAAVLAMAAA